MACLAGARHALARRRVHVRGYVQHGVQTAGLRVRVGLRGAERELRGTGGRLRRSTRKAPPSASTCP
jgi:hypothetical protein